MILGIDSMMYNSCVNEKKYEDLFNKIVSILKSRGLSAKEIDKLISRAKE